jgi:hypothetical protein
VIVGGGSPQRYPWEVLSTIFKRLGSGFIPTRGLGRVHSGMVSRDRLVQTMVNGSKHFVAETERFIGG